MKKQAWIVFTMASFLVLLGAAGASAQSLLMRVAIPFEFQVENQTFPAGTYTISDPGTTHAVLVFRNQTNGKGTQMVRLNHSQNPVSPERKAQLRFNQYGDQYWLSEVWNGTGSRGYVVQKSPREKELAKSFAEKTGAGAQVLALTAAGK